MTVPCTDNIVCPTCGEHFHCVRGYLHKAFHGCADHTWDEYGEAFCEAIS